MRRTSHRTCWRRGGRGPCTLCTYHVSNAAGGGRAQGARTGDHLEEPVAGRVELGEADRRRERRVERAEDEADDQQHRERPPRQARVAGVVGWRGRGGGQRRRVAVDTGSGTHSLARWRTRRAARRCTTSAGSACTP